MAEQADTVGAARTFSFLCVSELCESTLQTALEARLTIRLLTNQKFEMQNLICGCGGTADALVSGSSEEIRVGSNPVIRTNKMSTALAVVLVLLFDGI